MAIMKPSHSKATPHRGIAYILDREKVEAWGSLNLDTSLGCDAAYFGRQMMDTQHLHRKGYDPGARKYYHYKIAFAPADRDENDGPLTPELANQYAKEYAEKHWPGREVVWAVQGDGKARHIHFIVNAVELETGAMLDVKDAEWRRWKDDCQELCRQYGLTDIDWREAARKKRDRERDLEDPVELTKAEQGLKGRGHSLWKDELREKIDLAASRCVDLESFKEELAAAGVILTRCTETTISYKLGEHKACRGDSLGGDYTAAAIRDALQRNARILPPAKVAGKEHASLDAIISHSAGRKRTDPENLQRARQVGRIAGMRRSDVDQIYEWSQRASWAEKQEAWARCKEAKAAFWVDYKVRREQLQEEISREYELRRKIREAEWVLDPRNRKAGLIAMILALCFIRKHETVWECDLRILELKERQRRLREEMLEFKAVSTTATETLRRKNLSLDEYMESVLQLQDMSTQMMREAGFESAAQREAALEYEVMKADFGLEDYR